MHHLAKTAQLLDYESLVLDNGAISESEFGVKIGKTLRDAYCPYTTLEYYKF
jgi:hypothetical protein